MAARQVNIRMQHPFRLMFFNSDFGMQPCHQRSIDIIAPTFLLRTAATVVANGGSIDVRELLLNYSGTQYSCHYSLTSVEYQTIVASDIVERAIGMNRSQ
jgi:hypothetical protein